MALVGVGLAVWASGDNGGWIRREIKQSSGTPDITKVKELVMYQVPAGWAETDCGNGNLIYVRPAEAAQGCMVGTNPDSLISLSVKEQYTDCNQLQPKQSVTRHVCSSLFIDGNKTLKSTTTYPQNPNESAKTISNYYVNTGKSVVRIQYVYHADNSHQPVFEALTNSIKVIR